MTMYHELLPAYLNGENINRHINMIEAEDKRLKTWIDMLQYMFNTNPPILIECLEGTSYVDNLIVHINVPEEIQSVQLKEVFNQEDSFEDDNVIVTEYNYTDSTCNVDINYVFNENHKLLVLVETENYSYSYTYPTNNIEYLDILGSLLGLPRHENETDYNYAQRLTGFHENFGVKETSQLMLQLKYGIDMLSMENMGDWTSSIPEYAKDKVGNFANYFVTVPSGTSITEIQEYIDNYQPITHGYVFNRNISYNLSIVDPSVYLREIGDATKEQFAWFVNYCWLRIELWPKLYNACFDIYVDNVFVTTGVSDDEGFLNIYLYGLTSGWHDLRCVYQQEHGLNPIDVTMEQIFKIPWGGMACINMVAWQYTILSNTPKNVCVEPVLNEGNTPIENSITTGRGYLLYTPVISPELLSINDYYVYMLVETKYDFYSLYGGVGELTDITENKRGIAAGASIHMNATNAGEHEFEFLIKDNIIYPYIDGTPYPEGATRISGQNTLYAYAYSNYAGKNLTIKEVRVQPGNPGLNVYDVNFEEE